MMNSETDPTPHDDTVNAIVRTGAKGALMLASLSTAIVISLWFAFYFLVFLPRATPP